MIHLDQQQTIEQPEQRYSLNKGALLRFIGGATLFGATLIVAGQHEAPTPGSLAGLSVDGYIDHSEILPVMAAAAAGIALMATSAGEVLARQEDDEQ